MDASSVRSILCRAIDRLALLFRLVDPFASYGIYDIEHSQFVSCRGLFEMSVDFLNEYGLGLQHEIYCQHEGRQHCARRIRRAVLPGRCSRRARLVW